MALDYDPFSTPFTLDVDPVTADRQALTILKKLEFGKQSLDLLAEQPGGLDSDSAKQWQSKMAGLEDNLNKYKGYKKNRGEVPLSFAPEARARNAAEDREAVTRRIVDLFKSDDATFNQFVKEQGDEEFYKEWKGMLAGTDQTPKERYLVNKAMKLVGFTDREIDSGLAEPAIRKMTGAKESESEPTHGALLRWSLDQTNQFDRRHKIEKSAFEQAHVTFMGMGDDQTDDVFEKSLAEASPDLTNEERTYIRAIRNNVYGKLDKQYGNIRPLVKKTFNTIMVQDEATDKEQGDRFPDGQFANIEEAAAEFAKLPEDQFGAVVAMLAETAKAHGRDVDGFMSSMATSLDQAIGNSVGMAVRGINTKDLQKTMEHLQSGVMVPVTWGEGDEKKMFQLAQAEARFQSIPSTAYDPGAGPEDIERLMRGSALGADADAELRPMTPDEKKAVEDSIRFGQRALKYTSRLSKWREEVAKVDKGEWYSPKNWTYGLTQSLPELAMSLNPSGWVAIYEAQKERLVTSARDRNGSLELNTAENAGAAVAAFGYAGLAAMEGQILFSRMPGVKSVTGQFFAKIGAETLQEMGQDGMDPVTRKLFSAMGADMADVNLFTDGNIWDNLTKKGGELSNVITEAPRVAFTVAPLALLGVGGHEVASRMDRRALERLMKNDSMLELYGYDAAEIATVKGLPLDEAISYHQKRFQEQGFTIRTDMEESMDLDGQDIGVTMSANPDETITVSKNGKSKIARSPEEAAEVAREMDPAENEPTTATSRASQPRVKKDKGFDTNGLYNVRLDTGLDFQIFQDVDGTWMLNEQDTDGNFTELPGETRKQALTSLRQLSDQRIAERTNVADTTVDVDESQNLGLAHNANGLFGESELRVREGLPPAPHTAGGKVGRMARFRYGMQSFLFSRKVPSHSLDAMRVKGERLASGVRTQFDRIALTLDARTKEHLKTVPLAQRDAVGQQLLNDTYYALRGDTNAMASLPPKIQDAVTKGRESIDHYSRELANTNAVTAELADALKNNLGSYITRQFKVFDADANWNYTTIRREQPAIYDAAMNYMMATKNLSRVDADQAIKEMLDPSRAENFLAGSARVAKMDVTSFFKKKDLAPEIVALLGEVVNPAVNIRNTGAKVSEMLITNNAQNQMATWLMRNGLAFRKPKGRFTERLGEESVAFPTVDDNGNAIVMHTTRTKRAYAGFGKLYMEPEMAAALTEAFEPSGGGKSKFQTAFDALVKFTAAGKFAQVILNPAAYPTNFIGGVATEIFNGRISFDAKGARAYIKGGHRWNGTARTDGDIYGVTEQQASYAQTGDQFDKAGGVTKMSYNQITTEMEQRGIRDASVFARDLNDTVDQAFDPKGKFAQTSHVLSKGYQAADNAIKRSAFVHEVNKWAKAEPNLTMDQIFDRAAEDVRATTQNYDLVPKLLREFSQRGVLIPTYVSFAYELLRNTAGTARLATRELSSGNKVLMAHGAKRLTGMVTIATALYAMNEALTNTLTGMTWEEKEKLRKALPPWLKDSSVVFLKADDKELLYFDPSYIIPHQLFYNAASAVVSNVRKGQAGKALTDPLKIVAGSLGDMNILTKTVAEALTNQKSSGGEIYNPEVEADQKWELIAKHFKDNMFKPGFMRTLDKIRKAEKHEVGFAGSTASMDDIWAGLIGIRPYRLDTSSERFVVDNLIGYGFRNQSISSYQSERKESKRDDGEKKEAQSKVDIAREKLEKDFDSTVGMFKQLGISEERIYSAFKKANIPKELRTRAADILK